MRLIYGAASDAGKRRRENEDSLLVDFDPASFPEQPALFLVCDGVGGAVAGKTASTLAVNQIARAFRDSLSTSLSDRLVEAAERASAEILEHSLANPATEGMATTMVAAAFDARACQVVNVGDSRAYRLAAGRLERLTTDHTLVQEQVTSGLLSPEKRSRVPTATSSREAWDESLRTSASGLPRASRSHRRSIYSLLRRTDRNGR